VLGFASSWMCVCVGEKSFNEIGKNYLRNKETSVYIANRRIVAVCFAVVGLCLEFMLFFSSSDGEMCAVGGDYLSPPVLVLNAMTHSSPQDFKTVH
jgi:hypothetical protein